MEPLSAASAFATIIGLIGSFKTEQKSVSDDEYKVFFEWLQTKQHGVVIGHLEKNNRLAESIKHFLEEDKKVILQKLEVVDNVVAKIASTIDGLAEIAIEVKPNQVLSRQSINILKQLNDSNGSRFMEIKMGGGHSVFDIFEGGNITYDEPRFIEDDLGTLVELGLLRLQHSDRRHFFFTREAANFLKMQDKSNTTV